jgi:hypothetical protein
MRQQVYEAQKEMCQLFAEDSEHGMSSFFWEQPTRGVYFARAMAQILGLDEVKWN